MALSIGVSPGSMIRVGESTVLVREVVTPVLIVVSVDGGPDLVVSDKERTNLLPEVHVFAGVGQNQVGSRLAFEAPRRIGIHRVGMNHGNK